MTRREFLKGAAGFAVVLGGGWKALSALGDHLTPTPATAVGPLPIEGLAIVDTLAGADVTLNGELVFTVNESGRKLLALADGARTLDQVIVEAGCADVADSAAMFFVTLGQAGYMQNRVEVLLYENRV